MVIRETQINHASLVANIVPFNPALHRLLLSLGLEGIKGAMVLNNEINRQATTFAYMDVFQLSTYLMIATILFLPFVRLPKSGTVSDEPVVVEA